MSLAIRAHNLQKRFGAITAVNGVDLSVAKGEIFGLLGPNAAGKSTTIRLLAGILTLDGGDATVLGLDLAADSERLKRRIGYVAQNFALYPELTARENLDFYSSLYAEIGDKDKDALLAANGLSRFARRRAGQLSGGYKRRLSIVCALAHDPELVFLDEPTVGIDPMTRKELWDSFYGLSARGKALFITTHYMEEAKRCDKLAFIHQGRIVAHGTPAGIKDALAPLVVYACPLRHDPAVNASLMQLEGVRVLNQVGDELRIIVDRDVPKDALTRTLVKNTLDCKLREVTPTIEDVFIALTGTGANQ